MKKLLRIILTAVPVCIMIAFVMVLIQQLFPLPQYPVIAPLSYALAAAVILLVPDIGIVIMEIKAVRKQLIWMNAAAAVLYAVLFVIQLVTVPALLSEAVHSETSNAGDFGTYDAAVQKEMDALPLIREIEDNENIVSYHYDYAPMLENWNVQIETKWENPQQYEAELERLSTFETREEKKWHVMTGKAYGAVTAAYAYDDAEKTIQYYVCDGTRNIPES